MQGAESPSFHGSSSLFSCLFKAALKNVFQSFLEYFSQKSREISASATSQGTTFFEISLSGGEKHFGVRGLHRLL